MNLIYAKAVAVVWPRLQRIVADPKYYERHPEGHSLVVGINESPFSTAQNIKDDVDDEYEDSMQ